MLQLLFACLLFLAPANNHETTLWGQNGHRVAGEIASHHLSPEAQKAVDRVLGGKSMAIVSTWMDRIKSDPAYDHTHSWHWVTLPDGMKYEETDKNPDGDIINTIRTIINKLKKGNLTAKEETKNLKMLIHLVGDIHQPLHVGNGEDRGGNNVEVEWFGKPTNLHRVWDSEMISDRQLSYTELAASVDHASKKEIKKWQDTDVLDWAYESSNALDEVYEMPGNKQLGYQYQFKHRQLLSDRLEKAGIRLAGVLNEIYGD